MTRVILTASLIVLVNVLVGCRSVDSGESHLVPQRIKGTAAMDVTKIGEADIIEQMAINRQAYRQGLDSLIAYYENTGNNMKLAWAKNELKGLDDMPQYNYVIEAAVAGPELRAVSWIPSANYLYQDAMQIEKKAGELLLIKNEDNLRAALEKYNELIRKHPSSDKIDDAAFRAGGICEYFKDYSIALLYYQRAYQWDPDTTHPARFKTAYILDTRLHRRAEALGLYQEAVEKENLKKSYRDFAEKRINELSSSGEVLE